MNVIKNKNKNIRYHPITTVMNYETDETEFIMAVGKWQIERNIRFPTLSELLRILKSLGYEKK